MKLNQKKENGHCTGLELYFLAKKGLIRCAFGAFDYIYIYIYIEAASRRRRLESAI